MALNLQLPEGGDQFDAAVFTQAGAFVQAGHREECEQKAQEIGGLYCWIVNGRPVIRGDFEAEDAGTPNIEIQFDAEQSSAPIRWKMADADADGSPDAWQSTPFQTADAGHCKVEAEKMVLEWLKSQ